MRIGIFGGSFNPIHNGHIAIGRTMLNAMALDQVWYLVTPQNPWKESKDLLDENVRLELTRLALDDDPNLIGSDYEFHLERPSYTWNTLQNLKRDFPSDKFVLIIGGDNLAAFDKWAHYKEILDEYEIAVFPREGMSIDREKLPSTVHLVNIPLINITSTMLRKMLSEHKDVSKYIPSKALSKIKEERLWE